MKEYVEQIVTERAYDIRDMCVTKLVQRIVLAEATALIELDKDITGLPLDHTNLRLCMYIGQNTDIISAKQCAMQINSIATADAYWNGGSTSTYLNTGAVGAKSTHKFIDIFTHHNMVTVSVMYTSYHSPGTGTYGYIGGGTFASTGVVKSINSIKLFLLEGKFPVGTIIELYEQV